jgi:hypothetical protein
MAERTLTPEQIAEAQRLAREFKPIKLAKPGQAPAQPAKVDSALAGGPGQTAAVDSASSPDSKSGFVNVKAEDDTYEIFVDGAFVGNTPAKVKLAEGSHVVEVKKSGFKDYRRQITISAGSDLTLRAVLEKQ